MDTIHQDNELRQLFSRLSEEEPSKGFSERVMAQVMIEAQHAKQKQRIRNIFIYSAIACFSVAILVVGFYLADRYYDVKSYWNVSGWLSDSIGNTFATISDFFIYATVNKVFLLGALVLLLLLADLFIRRSVERRKEAHGFN